MRVVHRASWRRFSDPVDDAPLEAGCLPLLEPLDIAEHARLALLVGGLGLGLLV